MLLSADELQKLKSKLGAETESYIERLSSYIVSSGKKYKSHYATILSWTQKDTKNSGGVNYGSYGKKLCTEYILLSRVFLYVKLQPMFNLWLRLFSALNIE